MSQRNCGTVQNMQHVGAAISRPFLFGWDAGEHSSPLHLLPK
ncbi:hypothetical protein [Ruminococcus sp.]|nr:hypothetical protein [Ruminococcus sp.]